MDIVSPFNERITNAMYQNKMEGWQIANELTCCYSAECQFASCAAHHYTPFITLYMCGFLRIACVYAERKKNVTSNCTSVL